MAAVHEACLQFHWVWKDMNRYEMMWEDAWLMSVWWAALTSEVKPVLLCLTLQKDLWLAVPVNTWRCGVPWVVPPYPWHRARAGLRCTMITHQVGVYWVNFFFLGKMTSSGFMFWYLLLLAGWNPACPAHNNLRKSRVCGETHHLYLRASLNTWLLLFIFRVILPLSFKTLMTLFEDK